MKHEEINASDIIQFQNGIYRRIIKRMYALLIIFIVLFVYSVIDSIMIRNKLNDLLQEIDFVEESTYEISQDGEGVNNYIGNDGVINYGSENKGN